MLHIVYPHLPIVSQLTNDQLSSYHIIWLFIQLSIQLVLCSQVFMLEVLSCGNNFTDDHLCSS